MDIDGIFEKLKQMNFGKRTFKVGGESIICASLFGYPERMAKLAVQTRERMETLLG